MYQAETERLSVQGVQVQGQDWFIHVKDREVWAVDTKTAVVDGKVDIWIWWRIK